MRFLPAGKTRRALFFLALALFLVTRWAQLSAFPIFNDEAIYLQYAQAIHADWAANKYISMDGQYRDWKPPLQFWLAAPFLRPGHDPLRVGRTLALLFSLLGFAGFYAFAREFFGDAEGVLAALLFVLCPPVLLHNDQFTAETFLFSLAPWFYWAVGRALRAGAAGWAWALLALFLAVLLLLFKQSGLLLILLALALPLATRAEGGRWQKYAGDFVLAAAIIALGWFLAKLVLPAEFAATRAQFDSRWVFSLAELFARPWGAWQSNLRLVRDYTGAYYTWGVALLLLPVIWTTLRRPRPRPELALVLMLFGAGGAILIFLRGFNEYMFNTAVIALLLPLLARALTQAWAWRRERRFRGIAWLMLALSSFLALHWSYQVSLMIGAPARYLARSTPWALANYLRGWPSGFGVREAVARLATVEGAGIVFLDPQWGNPRTALEVYAPERFPNLQLVPITREFLDAEAVRRLRSGARELAPVRLVIFSADSSGARAGWQENVLREMCDERTEIKADPRQLPLVLCRF